MTCATALTHDAAAEESRRYVQARARHAQAPMTERYVHAAQVAFPGAAERQRTGWSRRSRPGNTDRVGSTPRIGGSRREHSCPLHWRAECHERENTTAIRRLQQAGDFPPDGLEYHVAFTSGGSFRVSEIWDSREQFEAFGQRLMPLLAEVGIELAGEPEIAEIHDVIKR